MSKVMVTIKGPGAAPTVEAIKTRYGLIQGDIDEQFGVVEIDPKEGVYTVLVEEHAAAKLRPDENWSVEGPFSNPPIAPFDDPHR